MSVRQAASAAYCRSASSRRPSAASIAGERQVRWALASLRAWRSRCPARRGSRHRLRLRAPILLPANGCPETRGRHARTRACASASRPISRCRWSELADARPSDSDRAGCRPVAICMAAKRLRRSPAARARMTRARTPPPSALIATMGRRRRTRCRITALDGASPMTPYTPCVIGSHRSASLCFAERLREAVLRQVRRRKHAPRVVALGIALEHRAEDALGLAREPGIARHARLSQQRIGQGHCGGGITRRGGHLGAHRRDRPGEIVPRRRRVAGAEEWRDRRRRTTAIRMRAPPSRRSPPERRQCGSRHHRHPRSERETSPAYARQN